MKLIVNWILSALALIVVAHVVPGFYVASLVSALIAAVIVGFVNATIGFILKILTFPLTIVTFGIFWFVVNAIMLKLAAAFSPGFQITGFTPAFLGAIVLSLVNLIFQSGSKAIFKED